MSVPKTIRDVAYLVVYDIVAISSSIHGFLDAMLVSFCYFTPMLGILGPFCFWALRSSPHVVSDVIGFLVFFVMPLLGASLLYGEIFRGGGIG